MKSNHTPGPWKVMPDPDNAGKHPLHDSRWIATADAEVEYGHDRRSWGLSEGTLICAMRDTSCQWADAMLVAAAPDLLAAIKRFIHYADNGEHPALRNYMQTTEGAKMYAALSKAERRAP